MSSVAAYICTYMYIQKNMYTFIYIYIYVVYDENGNERKQVRNNNFPLKNMDFGRGGLLIIRFINHGGPPVFKLQFCWASRGLLIRGGLIITS